VTTATLNVIILVLICWERHDHSLMVVGYESNDCVMVYFLPLVMLR